MECSSSNASNKIPRSEWYVPNFLLKVLGIVGPNVIDCVLNTLNTGVMPCGLNETYICLIPKVKYPQKIIEYRPINLCNMSYKIMSKVLAN